MIKNHQSSQKDMRVLLVEMIATVIALVASVIWLA